MITLAVGDDAFEGAREAAICWMRTRACREVLNVEVWVMTKSVSMCLLKLYNVQTKAPIGKRNFTFRQLHPISQKAEHDLPQ